MGLQVYEKRGLGAGFFGCVYYGILDSTPIAAKRYFRNLSVHDESQFLERCDHENIIKGKGVHYFEGKPYLIMELAERALEGCLGQNLFPAHAKRLLVQQTCLGLDYLHARSIVHRDIKASNLLLKSILPPHLVIGDFGAAETYLADNPIRSNHDIVRDAVYTSKSDIFLTGLVAFQIFEDLRYVHRETLADEILRRGFDVNIFTQGTRKAIFDSLNPDPQVRPTAMEFNEMVSE